MALGPKVFYIKQAGKEGWQPLNYVGRVHIRSQIGNSCSSQTWAGKYVWKKFLSRYK